MIMPNIQELNSLIDLSCLPLYIQAKKAELSGGVLIQEAMTDAIKEAVSNMKPTEQDILVGDFEKLDVACCAYNKRHGTDITLQDYINIVKGKPSLTQTQKPS